MGAFRNHQERDIRLKNSQKNTNMFCRSFQIYFPHFLPGNLILFFDLLLQPLPFPIR
jgi:hypothetical protein